MIRCVLLHICSRFFEVLAQRAAHKRAQLAEKDEIFFHKADGE